jgi:hypothetical protein
MFAGFGVQMSLAKYAPSGFFVTGLRLRGGGMKSRTLKFIQTAWVIEVALVILYTMFILPVLAPDRTGLWIAALPQLLAIIGSQGAAAGIGPLVSDYIKSRAQGGQQ